MEPIDEWTVAELKAELKDLGLSNSGNKEELYERLLDIEEEWDDEEDGFDTSEFMASLAGAVVRNRVAIGAVVAVVMLVVAVVVAGPSVLALSLIHI